MSKLTALHIHLIGAGTAIVLAVCLYFFLIKPKQEQTDQVKANTQTLISQGGTAEQVSAKQHELTNEKTNTAKIKAEWQVDEVKYMPPIHFGDMLPTYEYSMYPSGRGSEGLKDLPTEWGRWITHWYDAQEPAIMRLPSTVFPIESFSTDPNAISQLSALSFPQGKPWEVAVEAKGFNEAMAHLRRFNGIEHHGVPVVNNVALSGQSPHLLLTYTLQLFIIPPTAPPQADQRILNSGGQNGGGGGPGGFGPPGSFGPPGGLPGSGGSYGGGGGKGSAM